MRWKSQWQHWKPNVLDYTDKYKIHNDDDTIFKAQSWGYIPGEIIDGSKYLNIDVYGGLIRDKVASWAAIMDKVDKKWSESLLSH